ncbi:MAG: hypothetical protein IT557_10060 [Alphaproteobacteria bacterium]|nr:hypothetical protein [Alphaproteobacteria bacterium]
MGIIQDAQAAGELLFVFSQGSSPVMTGGAAKWGEASKGYCLGLVSVWLSLRAQGKDFAVDPHSFLVTDLDQDSDPLLQLSATSFNTGFAAQSDAKAPSNADKRLDFAHEQSYRAVGLRSVSVQAKTWFAPPDAAWIVRNVTRRPGQYVVIMRAQANAMGALDQHMFGIDAEGDPPATLRFFDPNGGGFVFASPARFEQWLTNYLSAMSYTSTFSKRTMVTPLKPPVPRTQELQAYKLYFLEIGQAMADQHADNP